VTRTKKKFTKIALSPFFGQLTVSPILHINFTSIFSSTISSSPRTLIALSQKSKIKFHLPSSTTFSSGTIGQGKDKMEASTGKIQNTQL
jgi:hypothetical protein